MKTPEDLYDYLNENPDKIINICRLCLTEDMGGATCLFQDNEIDKSNEIETFRKMFIEDFLKINLSELLPKNICRSCSDELNTISLFKIKCKNSESILNKILEEIPLKTEIDSEDEPIVKKKFKLREELSIKQEVSHENHQNNVTNINNEISDEVIIKTDTLISENTVECVNNDEEFDDSRSDSTMEIRREISITQLDEEFHCKYCNKHLANRKKYVNHMRYKHGHSFKIEKKYEWKVTGVGAERRFFCPHCDYKCHRLQGMRYHVTTHTGEKPYKCDQCPMAFSQHGPLNQHKATHSDTRFICAVCGKQFRHRCLLQQHKRVHNIELKFPCDICKKILRSKKTLQSHKERHLNISKFNCEICGATFVARPELSQHQRIHSGIKQHKCHLCSYETHSKGKLNIHIDRHTGKRDFKCEVCDYSCYTRNALKMHMVRHTKEKKYNCPVCDKKFAHSHDVNRHMFKIHGEKFRWNDFVVRKTIGNSDQR